MQNHKHTNPYTYAHTHMYPYHTLKVEFPIAAKKNVVDCMFYKYIF